MISFERVICFVFALLFVSCFGQEDASTSSEEQDQHANNTGADYLRSVMERLQNERNEESAIQVDHQQPTHYLTSSSPSRNGTGAATSAAFQAEIVPSSSVDVPEIPPGLTPQQLTDIYNAAVTKLANLPQHQSVSEFHHPPPPSPSAAPSTSQRPVSGLLPGYYYYYYPIKSFVKVNPNQDVSTTPKPLHINATLHMTQTSNKSVEPLFMAISGFIGMALMFAFSVLFVPKFGKLRSGDGSGNAADLIALTRVLFDSMEGKDCAHRLACELGTFVRRMKMDNKPMRVLEIVLPPKLGKQIAQVRKAAARREKCSLIQCKLKKPQVPRPKIKSKTANANRKPWKTAETAHELWMKNFQNQTTKFSQPDNIWHRH